MENLSDLIDYHLWAHRRLLELLPALTAEEWNIDTRGSFPTLKALYQHILEGDYRWLQRWKGVPIAEVPAHYRIEGYESLDRLFRPQLDEMVVSAKQWLASGPDRPVYFITGKGLHVTQPFWQTFYQVVNHGTYHRGQVAHMLRALGRQPATTDIFLFFLEKDQQHG
ncbi:MAG TPA: DinB family protein [Puia sp.]|uniref:DinB family protein n=1 Tax=Puia sp. TaxID=2045100 RepID=UPI002CCFD656|nr:DinB family protein [Puia sp.]HVU96044.1 DinB family protein [Puia sp.]